MKRIFASMLAVIMLVSCFAVSTFAATHEITYGFEEVTAKQNDIVDFVFNVNVKAAESQPDGTNPTIDFLYNYDTTQLELQGGVVVEGYPEADLYDATEPGALMAGCFLLNPLVSGETQVVTVKFSMKVLAPAGTVITLTPNEEGTGYADNFGTDQWAPFVEAYSFTVEADETTPPETDPPTTEAPVYTTAAVVGGQIRHASIDGSKDMRLCFAVTDNGADVASKAFKVTIGGDTKTVDCVKVFDTKGDVTYYTVCIYDIPADAFDTEISAVLELTHADGTVTASDVLTRTVNGVEAIMAA